MKVLKWILLIVGIGLGVWVIWKIYKEAKTDVSGGKTDFCLFVGGGGGKTCYLDETKIGGGYSRQSEGGAFGGLGAKVMISKLEFDSAYNDYLKQTKV